MRTALISAAALLAAVTVANASEATGSIKTIDAAKATITLDSGKSYILAKTIKVGDLTVGEKVKVTYDVKAGKNQASAVVAAN